VRQKKPTTRLLISCIVFGVFGAGSVWAVTNGASSALDILVEQLNGTVDVTMAGAARDVSIGSKIDLPSRILTGEDGRILVRQGRTGVDIAPRSDVEILEAAGAGQLIAHMFQHSGSAFYDIETRTVDQLRVDTPYLVAVVKGTQFNVTVIDGTTTISLFEGRLEIRTPDDSQVVELNAGEIAIRSILDGQIRLLPMDPGLLDETIALNARDAGVGDAAGALGAAGVVRPAGEASDVALVDPARVEATVAVGSDGAGSQTGFGAAINDNLSAGVGFAGNVDVGESLSVTGGIAAAVDPVAVDAGIGVDASLGGGTVDAGADVGLDTNVDLGGASVDLGADAGLDAGVDLAGGTVDVGLDAGLDADLAGVDAGVDAGLDVGLDDAGLDAGLDVGVETDLLDVGLDASLDEGVDVDLGLGGSDGGTDGGSDDGGLLGGLLGPLL